jgi:hypothetical protein
MEMVIESTSAKLISYHRYNLQEIQSQKYPCLDPPLSPPFIDELPASAGLLE